MKMLAALLGLIGSLPFSAKGQLCQGSLGDPVVNITFGSGANPGTAIRAAATSYQYVSKDCPNDGYYTIRNATAQCFASGWFTVNADHTPGDTSGYFMLVNASYEPGDFYVDTVNGLCANTTYEFAAWVANMLQQGGCGGNDIRPNLTFSIEKPDGAKLGTYNTGDIAASASFTWKQYGIYFTTPPGVADIVLRITNNAPGGCGNDLALDDITFRPCGPTVRAGISGTGEVTAMACERDTSTIRLIASSSPGYANPAYLWQVSTDSGANWKDIPGTNSNTYLRLPTGAGNYLYRQVEAESSNISFSACRVASNNIDVNVNPLPDIGAGSNSPLCDQRPLLLHAGGGAQYNWTGPDGFTSGSPEPEINPAMLANAGTYHITVRTEKGCADSASVDVVVHPNPVAQTGPDISICEGSSTPLTASGGTGYNWSPPYFLSSAHVANPLAAPQNTTTYTVVVSNAFGCSDTTQETVNVWKKPVAGAGPDKIINEGTPVALEGNAGGDEVSWYWTPSGTLDHPDSLRPLANPPQDMTYTLHVVSGLGCGSATDNAFVRVYKPVKVPNAFSPNGDGIHDTWVIPALDTYPQSDLRVFDRSGQKIFESIGYRNPWDGRINGKPLPVGTYYYVIDLKEGNFPRLTGWVFIVR